MLPTLFGLAMAGSGASVYGAQPVSDNSARLFAEFERVCIDTRADPRAVLKEIAGWEVTSTAGSIASGQPGRIMANPKRPRLPGFFLTFQVVDLGGGRIDRNCTAHLDGVSSDEIESLLPANFTSNGKPLAMMKAYRLVAPPKAWAVSASANLKNDLLGVAKGFNPMAASIPATVVLFQSSIRD